MKSTISSIILLLITTPLYSQSFTIGEDGIVRCKGVSIGTTRTLFGDVYEAVDRNLLNQRKNQGRDLTKVCVSNVTDMSWLFSNTQFNQPIGNWDVSSVTNMSFMFYVSKFNQPIGNWDVSSVTNMKSMFYISPFNQPIGNWDVSSVTDMNDMFRDSKLNQPIGNWDVSSVTDMSGMFYGTPFNQPIGNWDVSSVTDMSAMFLNSPFNQPIRNWDVSSVTNMLGMFIGSSFNQPIGNWDVSSVINMSNMFVTSQFNQPIWYWNVSSVTNMDAMFQGSKFNQSISLWCVSKITSEPNNFSTNSLLAPTNKPVWGTCPIISPFKTIQLAPSQNSIGVSRKVKFNWNRDNRSTKYHLQVFEGFDPIVVDVLVKDTTYQNPSTFKGNVDYYWRVRGYHEPSKTYGEWSSVWKFTTQLGTSIESDEQPSQFSLYQNYPNPFNPTTQIAFSLPNTTHVQLEVYSILGHRISTLIDGTLNTGNHTVSFDGSNLSSGVYIYRLTTPSYTQSRLMNLVK